jgi:hypothetical protein
MWSSAMPSALARSICPARPLFWSAVEERAYLAATVKCFRSALDALGTGQDTPTAGLKDFTEGGRDTVGAYRKTWR